MCRVYYVTSPNQKKIVPRMENYEDDGPWMWVAFAPGCRLIVAFAIGPRKQYVADELVESTAKCLSESMPLFVSDGLEFYAKALLKKFGETEEFSRTGKRGRPKKPKLAPPDDLRYAQVIKKRKGGKLQKIVKKIPVSYTHLRAHETRHDIVCRLLLEKKKNKKKKKAINKQHKKKKKKKKKKQKKK